MCGCSELSRVLSCVYGYVNYLIHADIRICSGVLKSKTELIDDRSYSGALRMNDLFH